MQNVQNVQKVQKVQKVQNAQKAVEPQDIQRRSDGVDSIELDSRAWYRSERVFCSDGSWFFHTREGIDVGPYKTQFDAELEADILISRLCQTNQERHIEMIRSHVFESDCSFGTLNTAAFTDYLVEVGGAELLHK